jgi:hypothetical protein
MNPSPIIAEPFAAPLVRSPAAPPRQRWVLSPMLDGLLIIAAPVLSLLLAIAAFAWLPAEQAATLVLLTHVVLTVAHHLPTWVRLYGDLDTYHADRWRWLLMPVIPFLLALAVLIHLQQRGYGLEPFFYLFILLTIWDPWHFLMQHYGFMRLYDRGNAAPPKLAAGMDRMVCSVWMVYLLLASSAWLPELLVDLDRWLGLPLLQTLPMAALAALGDLAALLAALGSLVYAAYLIVCWRRGWFISSAKLALLVLGFAAMWLSYTPNALIRAWAPGWSFKVGFAVIGIVHMTQYLAIVWRYNRNLAARPGAARPGWFRWLHSRNSVWAALLYVLVCLAYGEGLTTGFDSVWLTIPLLALGFTSTLMHYYFDGFIWKLRQPGTAATLDGRAPAAPSPASATLRAPTRREWLRPLLVFGLPLGLMTAAAAATWVPPQLAWTDSLKQAVEAARDGDRDAALRAARRARLAMDEALPKLRALARLEASAARDTELALLLYSHRWLQYALLPQLDGRAAATETLALQRDGLAEPLQLLDRALARGGSVAHPGRPSMSVDDAHRLRDGWQRQLQQLDARLAAATP